MDNESTMHIYGLVHGMCTLFCSWRSPRDHLRADGLRTYKIYLAKCAAINRNPKIPCFSKHYNDVTMGASLAIVYSTVDSNADQRKYQSSASLAFVRGTHRGPVNSQHNWPVTRKMFPYDDVIMSRGTYSATCESLVLRYNSKNKFK